MKCECYCGCDGFGDYSGDEFFECCDMWFCTPCFSDHVEDMEHQVDDGSE